MKNNNSLLLANADRRINKAVFAGMVFGSFLLSGVSVANATVIRGAVSVTEITSLGNQGAQYSIDNVINQSGLSATYSNGDNFESFTSTTKHSYAPGDEWWAPYYSTEANILFDLGAEFEVEKVAFWNEDWGGISSLEIFVSDAAGTQGTSLGTFFPTDNTFEQDYLADVFEFSNYTNARYLRFDLDGAGFDYQNVGFVDTISLGEVAFSVEPVPEPATLLLFGAGLAGLIGLRRKNSSLRCA